MMKLQHDILKHLFEEQGQTPAMAEKLASTATQKSYHKSFTKLVNTPRKKTGGAVAPLNNATVALPILKDIIGKLAGNPQVAKQTYAHIKPALVAGGKISGGKENAVKSAVRFISKLIGVIKPIATPALGSLIASYGIPLPQAMSIANVATNAIDGVARVADNELNGTPLKPLEAPAGNGSEGGFSRPPNARGSGQKKTSVATFKIRLL
jgi:hypothetical protein